MFASRRSSSLSNAEPNGVARSLHAQDEISDAPECGRHVPPGQLPTDSKLGLLRSQSSGKDSPTVGSTPVPPAPHPPLLCLLCRRLQWFCWCIVLSFFFSTSVAVCGVGFLVFCTFGFSCIFSYLVCFMK
ncbi:hypothetical protein I3843_16G103600 [Carya illinoinensis]|nr:hypothetical protein I3843_16G103600 [Carya illinoinensis]